MDFKQWLEMYGALGIFYLIFALFYAVIFNWNIRSGRKKALLEEGEL